MRTDGYNGKADLYRPKSSVNMMSSTDSDLPLACGSACSRDPELVFQMPVFNPKTSQGWRRLANSSFQRLGRTTSIRRRKPSRFLGAIHLQGHSGVLCAGEVGLRGIQPTHPTKDKDVA